MTAAEAGALAHVRVARVGGLVLVGLAILAWVAPVNVPSRDGFFACGSPSAPAGMDPLFDMVCATSLNESRTWTLILLLSAAAVLLLSEQVAPRMAGHSWLAGVIAVSPVALPLIATSIGFQFTIIGGMTQDWTPFRCGTGLRPAIDPFSAMACGGLAQTRLVLGIGGTLLGLGLLAAGAYVARARPIGTTVLPVVADPAQAPREVPRAEPTDPAEPTLATSADGSVPTTEATAADRPKE